MQCMVHTSLLASFSCRLSRKILQVTKLGGPGNKISPLPQQSKWCNHTPHRALREPVEGELGQVMVGTFMNQIS